MPLIDPATIQAAKERLPIPTLWTLLGLPGQPKRKCRSPFREERHASFSIHANGQRFTDFGTGDTGDAIDFLARALGLSPAQSLRRFLELAGATGTHANEVPFLGKRLRSHEVDERLAKRHRWPVFHAPTVSELAAVAELRGLSVEGVTLAADRGLLWCADSAEGRAWVITDSTRRNAQARRLDGRPWERIDAKAWTLPGSEAAWPIGLRESAASPALVLVEGGPDLLAACHLAWIDGLEEHFFPVALLGASQHIPPAALPSFAGKPVRLFSHDDPAGTAAALRWANQLHAAGASPALFSFSGFLRHDGTPVRDLNDFVHLHPDQWEEHQHTLHEAFTFPLTH